jgi:hypothetical protein
MNNVIVLQCDRKAIRVMVGVMSNAEVSRLAERVSRL